jgi:hypothetical protein
MAKTITLFIALLLTGATAFFSFDSLGKMKKLRLAIHSLEEDISGLNKNIETTDSNIATRTTERNDEQRTKGNRIAERDGLRGDITSLTNEVPGLDKNIEEQQAVIAKYQGIIDDLGKFFAEMNVNDLEELQQKIQELEASRVQREKEVAETQALVEAARASIARTEGLLGDWRTRQSNRSQAISHNAAEPQVVAVNNDWGFVVINAGSNQGYSPEKALIVKRGETYVAKLAITSLQKNQMVADIVPKSVAQGQVVQPGDRVVLATPNR